MKNNLNLLFIIASIFFLVTSSFKYKGNNSDNIPEITLDQIDPTIFFKKTETGLKQAVNVTLTANKAIGNILLKANYGEQTFSLEIADVNRGQQTTELFFPDIRDQVEINFGLYVEDVKIDDFIMGWIPQKHWQIYLVHGSHHDLGYTDLPDRILEEHKGYMEEILNYCELTENWPEESKFHYVIEEGWSALYFMEHSTQELREKFIYYLQNGQLELTALFANQTTDICGFEELNRLIYPSFELKRKYNIPLHTAEISDIPGINWGMISVLAGSGIKYLYGGVQDYFAWGREVPVPWDEERVMKRDHSSAFYWKGPSNDSILFWYGGGSISNVWLWDLHQGEDALNKYLMNEQNNGYQFDMILTNVLGGFRDNSLPDMRHSEIVKAMNEKWEYPKIKFTTKASFFNDFEKKHGADLKTIKGDFNQTDYNIGAISTPKETGINRMNHDLLTSAETFSSIATSITDYPYARDQIAESYERMILYDEHCWGMANPTGPAQEAAESQKSYHAYQAAALGHDILVKNLNKIADQVNLKNEGIHIVVFNPLSFERTDVVEVQTLPFVPIGKPFFKEQRQIGDHYYFVNRPGEVPGRKQLSIPSSFLEKPFQIRDISTGKIINHQLRVIDDPLLPIPYASSRYALSQVSRRSQAGLVYGNNQVTDLFFVAEDIPPLGYKVYQLIPVDNENQTLPSAELTDNSIDTKFYKIVFNNERGIISVFDKQQNKELMNVSENFAMGEILIKPVESPDFISSELLDVSVKENGPVFTSLYLKRKAVNCPVINQEIILYHQLKRIDFSTRIIKNPVPFYEIYLGFPFLVNNPQYRISTVNSIIEPIVDQLPGTTTDYYSIQHGLSTFNKENTITWSSIEAPLVKISELWPGYVSQAHHGKEPFNYVHNFTENFKKSNIYSYVSVNNFRTNFSPVYSGDMMFRHSITSYAGSYDPIKSNNHGWAASNPLIPVIISGPSSGVLEHNFPFCEIDNDNIRLITIKAAEDGEGFIMRLAETSGEAVNTIIQVPFINFSEVYQTNIAEENIESIEHSDGRIKITAKPFEIITLRLKSNMDIPVNTKYFYSY